MVTTKPFHVKCPYTNLLVCTCTHGATRFKTTKEKEEFSEHAEKLWKLYKKSRSADSECCTVVSAETRREPRPHPLLFRGMHANIALPALKPRFPLSNARRTQGWTVAELREAFGDDDVRLILESAFSPKQWKQMAKVQGGLPQSRGPGFGGGDLDELAQIMGNTRIRLEDVRRYHAVSREQSEGLEARSLKMQEAADAFEAEVSKELQAGANEGEGASKALGGAGEAEEAPEDSVRRVDAQKATRPSDAAAATEDDGEGDNDDKTGGRGDEDDDVLVPFPRRKRTSRSRKAREDFGGMVAFAAQEEEGGDGEGKGEGNSLVSDEQLALRLHEELNAPPTKRLRFAQADCGAE